MDQKELSDLVNKTYRLVVRNCNGRPELVQMFCQKILERALENVRPEELKRVILEYDEDVAHLKPAKRKP